MTKQEFLAFSLPYGLFAIDKCDFDNNDFDEIVIYNGLWYSDEFQTNNNTLMIPILRPLSDLTKPIEHKGEVFVPIDKILEESCFDLSKMTRKHINSYAEPFLKMPELLLLSDAMLLISWHFDISGLIDKGEAIDYSTLEGFSF